MEGAEAYVNYLMNRKEKPIHGEVTSLVKESGVSKLILVIDDSATVRKIVETCLHREGYEVKGFEDGIAAMRWLVDEKRVPDLAFIDIGLPKMDGFEVTRRIREKAVFQNMVIIMLSRRDGMLDKLKARLAGAREYITKPFKTEEIVNVVKKYVGKQGEQGGENHE